MRDAIKRGIDVVGATSGLILLSPLLAVTAVVVRLAIGGPVLFRQVRPGLHGQPFTVYKFRSMRDTRDANGTLLSDGERLTRFGRFLRSTSLDEVPELWNVLRGDMSLVGPRPLLLEYLPLYSRDQARRHSVRPGITGLAQVKGRNRLDWDAKLALDVWYVDHHSLVLDLKILLLTAARVLGREGITQPGHATTEPFRGTTG